MIHGIPMRHGRVQRCWPLLAWLLSLTMAPTALQAETPRAPKNDDSEPAVSPDGSRVVFQSRRYGPSDLFSMASGGSYPRRLTEDAGNNANPAWAPAGDRIAFESDRTGAWQIHVMMADGSDPRAVTQREAGAREPSFSANGHRIAFVGPVGEVSQIMEVSLSDGAVRQLTRSPGDKSQPAFSPDGKWLAYVSTATGGQEIYVADASGTGARRVTHFTDSRPRQTISGLGWAPQGELIFASNRDGRGRFFFATDVFTLTRDGRTLRRILSDGENHNNPSMALNGSVIAFDALRYGGLDVFVVNADGSNLRNLTASSHTDFFATPTPDGRRVVFQSERDGQREIYMMGRDGTGVRNLSHHPSDDRAPSLSAGHPTIAFASFRDSPWGDIYTMAMDGNDVSKVTPDGFFEALDQFPIATAITPDAGTILFEAAPVLTQGEAHWDIWRIDRDGTHAARLTSSSGTARSSSPAISPDGTSFLYFSNESGNFEIYRMSLQGGEPERLTNDPAADYYPTWSPDGRYIYFSSRRDGAPDVFRMAPDGTGVERVTHGTPTSYHLAPVVSSTGDLWVLSNSDGGTYIHRLGLNGAHEVRVSAPWGPTSEDPALSTACTQFTRLGQSHWSPVGHRIVFPGDCAGDRDLYVFDFDTDLLTRLDVNLDEPDSPAWSHAGDRIAFNAKDAEGNRDLYILNLQDQEITRVTEGGAHGGWVTWSPDDEWLNGYGPNGHGTWDIFRVRADGSERVRLNEQQDANYYAPAESPTGHELLYAVRNRIWARVDGGQAKPLTPGRIAAVMPRWAPDGEHYLFDGNDGLGWNIYTTDRKGSAPVRLTQRSEVDGNGSWSPDGKTVICVCQMGEFSTLCVVDVDTRRSRPLFLTDDAGSHAPVTQ